MKKDAMLKQIATVKLIVSNGNHVETSSNIWVFRLTYQRNDA
jgi:hypothetical protein